MMRGDLTKPRRPRVLLAAAISLAAVSLIVAQVGRSQSTDRGAMRPVRPDHPFRGTIELLVDATDVQRGIFSVRETIPVQDAGDMVLLYPKWETASHAPTVPVASLAGLIVRIDGQRVEWRRDPFDAHAFRLALPPGAKQVTAEFQDIADRGTIREQAE